MVVVARLAGSALSETTAAQVTWCSVSAGSRLVSGHLWGLYRWPVAVVVTAFAVAGFEAVLGSVGSVVGIAAGLGCLWFLPGPRVGAGFDADGVTARGWVLRRRVAWSDVDVLRLGLVSGPMGSGRFPGVAAACGKRDVSLQRWLGSPSARSRGVGPLVAAARDHGVVVLLEPAHQYAFPGIEVDLIGLVRRVDGVPTPTAEPDRITRRSADVTLGVVCLACLVGTGMVVGGLVAHRGGIVAAGLAPCIVAGVLLVEVIPLWRWARARTRRA